MKAAVLIVRVLMGLGFIVFGSNMIHPFLPQPPLPDGPLLQFMTVMATSGWMQVIGFFQVLGGVLVLSGRMAPLGLTILGGILVNILCTHVFLQHGEGLVPGLIFSAFEIFLLYAYRSHFTGIFSTNAKPQV